MSHTGDAFQSTSASASLLVGRERELGLLREALDRTVNGQGGLALVGGEAGIGKTALVNAAVREAVERGALVLTGHCYDLSTTPPYGPWLEITDRYPTDADLPEIPEVLQRGTGVGDLANQMALFEVVRDFLFAVAEARPLVVVLEDLHWSDPASLDLLRYLGRQLDGHRLLMIATYRDDEITREHALFRLLPLLAREASADLINLRSLHVGAIQDLVTARWPLAESDGARLAAFLRTRTEGNPLYIREVLRTLEDERLIRRQREAWTLGELGQASIPPLLKQVIEGRLARLAPEARDLLQIASVIGHRASLDVWQDVSGADDDALANVLEQALDAQIVSEASDGLGVQFTHALIRETLYVSAVLPRRRSLHRSVGEFLAKQVGADPDAVAFHFAQARDERAFEWYVKAGERAFRTLAWLSAVDRFQAALVLMPDDPERLAERGWLHLRLGSLHRYADPRRGIPDLEEALRIARAINDEALFAHALVEIGMLHCTSGSMRKGIEEMEAGVEALDALPADQWRDVSGRLRGMYMLWLGAVGPASKVIAIGERDLANAELVLERVHWGLAWAYAAAGRPDDSRRAFQRAREALIEQGDIPSAGALGFNDLTEVALQYFTDDVTARQSLADQTYEFFKRGSGSITGWPPEALYSDLWILDGRWDDVRDLLLSIPAGRFAQWTHYVPSRLGWLEHARGNRDEAWRHVYASLTDGPATEPGDCFFPFVIRLHRLAVDLALDDENVAMAEEWLDAHDRWLTWHGAVAGRAEEQLLWARLHEVNEDIAQARRHGEEAVRLASDPRQPLVVLLAHRFIGSLERQVGDHVAAERHLAESLALADACAAPYERALTLLEMAHLRAETGDSLQAMSMINEASHICAALGARPALERARSLAARYRLRPRRGALPFDLTQRELEVLQFLAHGKSDREIADALYISPRTVMRHVSNILGKLDVESRTAAATFAVRHGIVGE